MGWIEVGLAFGYIPFRWI